MYGGPAVADWEYGEPSLAARRMEGQPTLTARCWAIERQDGFFAANRCRRVCNDWPLVAALLLVLSLIAASRRVASNLTGM
jgi:hypothetical protein